MSHGSTGFNPFGFELGLGFPCPRFTCLPSSIFIAPAVPFLVFTPFPLHLFYYFVFDDQLSPVWLAIASFTQKASTCAGAPSCAWHSRNGFDAIEWANCGIKKNILAQDSWVLRRRVESLLLSFVTTSVKYVKSNALFFYVFPISLKYRIGHSIISSRFPYCPAFIFHVPKARVDSRGPHQNSTTLKKTRKTSVPRVPNQIPVVRNLISSGGTVTRHHIPAVMQWTQWHPDRVAPPPPIEESFLFG